MRAIRRAAGRAMPLLVGVVVATGCDSDPAVDGGFEVVMEGGVPTMVNHAPARRPGSWALAERPRVQVGEVEGEAPYLFQRILFAGMQSGGELVVVDAGAPVVRVFSAEGAHLRSQGRAGEGPGEYRNVVQARRLPGDTLVLVEFPGRYSFVRGDGTFVRRIVPPRVGGSVWFVTGGRALWVSTTGTSGELGPRSERGTLVAGDESSPTGDTIAVLDGGETVVVSSGAITANVRVPYATGGVMAVDPPGRLITSGAGYELVYRDLESGTETRARLDRAPRPVTGSDWDRAVAADIERIAGASRAMPDLVRAWEQGLGQAHRPAVMPAFDLLLVDRAGNAWAREFVAPGETPAAREWEVFDRDGRWVTTVSIPVELEILDIGEDQVVARWSDELGVQRVRVYDLEKRS